MKVGGGGGGAYIRANNLLVELHVLLFRAGTWAYVRGERATTLGLMYGIRGFIVGFYIEFRAHLVLSC